MGTAHRAATASRAASGGGGAGRTPRTRRATSTTARRTPSRTAASMVLPLVHHRLEEGEQTAASRTGRRGAGRPGSRCRSWRRPGRRRRRRPGLTPSNWPSQPPRTNLRTSAIPSYRSTAWPPAPANSASPSTSHQVGLARVAALRQRGRVGQLVPEQVVGAAVGEPVGVEHHLVVARRRRSPRNRRSTLGGRRRTSAATRRGRRRRSGTGPAASRSPRTGRRPSPPPRPGPAGRAACRRSAGVVATMVRAPTATARSLISQGRVPVSTDSGFLHGDQRGWSPFSRHRVPISTGLGRQFGATKQYWKRTGSRHSPGWPMIGGGQAAPARPASGHLQPA